jgi:NitT/TauT family transport system permease protein
MTMRQRLAIMAARALLVAAILLAWHLASGHSRTMRFFLGEPEAVAAQLVDWFSSGEIWRHLGVTLLETLLSFFIGAAAALAIGLWLALGPFRAAVFDPFIKAANAMPRLILAPIFSVWLGLGIWSKVALGVTLVFFVVFFNVFQGIREVSPVVLANTRMLGASRWQLVRRVYVPSAMSWVFSSLHVSIGMAFVGAVIGEYLGSAAGVGYLILQAEGTFDIDGVLAGVVLLTICALLLDALIGLVETRLLVWRPAQAGQ